MVHRLSSTKFGLTVGYCRPSIQDVVPHNGIFRFYTKWYIYYDLTYRTRKRLLPLFSNAAGKMKKWEIHRWCRFLLCVLQKNLLSECTQNGIDLLTFAKFLCPILLYVYDPISNAALCYIHRFYNYCNYWMWSTRQYRSVWNI